MTEQGAFKANAHVVSVATAHENAPAIGDRPAEGGVFKANWQGRALEALAFVAVVASGLLLGAVLLSPRWSQAVTVIGMTTIGLVLLLQPAAGLLLWIFLAPYAEHIYLKFDLGAGIPDLDISRLALLLLGLRLISQATVENLAKPAVERRRLAPFTIAEAAMLSFIIGISLSVREDLLTFIAIPLLMFYMAPPLTYYYARNWLRSEAALRATIAVIALGSTLLAIIAIREQLFGIILFSPRNTTTVYEGSIRKVLSLFGAPGIMTTSLAITVPLLLLGIARATTLRARLLLGTAFLTTLAGVFFVYVRAGWLGAVLGLVSMMALSPRIRRLTLRLLPIVFLIAVLLIGSLIDPSLVQKRLASEAPISYRLTAWQIAWEIFLRSPLTGAGFNTFGQIASTEYVWTPHELIQASPHNSYLYVLASAGLLGFVPYVSMFIALFWRGLSFWRRGDERDLVATLWATLIAYTAINATLDSVDVHFSSVLLFLIFGALLGRLEEARAKGAQT